MDDFKYLLNKESNKKCLILGGAPSIEEIQFEKFDGILISMGDIPERIREIRQIDYWVAANSIFPRPDKHYDLLNKFKGTKFIFSNSALNSTISLDYQKISQYLKIPWFEYDQRHFNGLDCNDQTDYQVNPGLALKEPLNCCKYKKNITIQEYLRDLYNLDSHYSSGSTVAIHSLAIAIILGCKEIYLSGIDLPEYEKDYTHYRSNSIFRLLFIFFKEILKGDRTIPLKNILSVIFKTNTKSSFYFDLPTIIKDFEYLTNLCESNGIRLFNLSSKSSLNKIHNLKLLNPSDFNKL
tara:strand:- start:17368 stop:18252 length:885 start_codon:yes stop_codon:yes gene_type:complete